MKLTRIDEVSSQQHMLGEGEDAGLQSYSGLLENPAEGIFVLPAGYVDDDGSVHFEVEISPVTGTEEEFIAEVPPNAPIASVVTSLLSTCVKRIGTIRNISPQLIRKLLVCDRDYIVFKLRQVTFGGKVHTILHCPSSKCAEPMDINFHLDEISIERKSVSMRFFSMNLSPNSAYRDRRGKSHTRVEFRLPTGEDQETVASLSLSDNTGAVPRVLSRCISRVGDVTRIDEQFIRNLPGSAITEIEEKIREITPNVEIEIEAVCPECETPFSTFFDLTSFFFSEMKSNLRSLEREVHFLALHYHWSEREILEMTRLKRRRYISLLNEAMERSYQY